jgi:hypothetical protein
MTEARKTGSIIIAAKNKWMLLNLGRALRLLIVINFLPHLILSPERRDHIHNPEPFPAFLFGHGEPVVTRIHARGD